MADAFNNSSTLNTIHLLKFLLNATLLYRTLSPWCVLGFIVKIDRSSFHIYEIVYLL